MKQDYVIKNEFKIIIAKRHWNAWIIAGKKNTREIIMTKIENISQNLFGNFCFENNLIKQIWEMENAKIR